MNQKQKDVLCRMLNDQAKKTKEQLGGRFQYYSVSTYTLLKKDDRDDKVLNSIIDASPTKTQNTIKKLRARQEKIDLDQKNLEQEMKKLVDGLEKIATGVKDKREAAKDTLKEALNNAIVKIQFAEDVEAAQAVLNSLPSFEELTK